MGFKFCLFLNLYSCAFHLVHNVFVVAEVVLKIHHWFPGVMLSIDAAAGVFNVLVACHSQRIPAHKVLYALNNNKYAKTLKKILMLQKL